MTQRRPMIKSWQNMNRSRQVELMVLGWDEFRTEECSAGWRRVRVVGTSSARSWGPFLMNTLPQFSLHTLQDHTWSERSIWLNLTNAVTIYLLNPSSEEDSDFPGRSFTIPWLISSTTRKGQYVRSCRDTKYRIVDTERSCATNETKSILNNRRRKTTKTKKSPNPYTIDMILS